jgi:hypothetical protein
MDSRAPPQDTAQWRPRRRPDPMSAPLPPHPKRDPSPRQPPRGRHLCSPTARRELDHGSPGGRGRARRVPLLRPAMAEAALRGRRPHRPAPPTGAASCSTRRPPCSAPATAAAREHGGADEAVGEPAGVEERKMEVSVEEVTEDHHKC